MTATHVMTTAPADSRTVIFTCTQSTDSPLRLTVTQRQRTHHCAWQSHNVNGLTTAPDSHTTQTELNWMKQLTWLRIVNSGDWCLHMALHTPSGACPTVECIQ